MFEAWFLAVVLASLGCGLCVFVWDAIAKTDKRSFEQRDWVAQRRRRLERNGFKARMGHREYR